MLFDINRKDNTLCGLYLTSSKNKSPVEFRGEVELTDQSSQLVSHSLLFAYLLLLLSIGWFRIGYCIKHSRL